MHTIRTCLTYISHFEPYSYKVFHIYIFLYYLRCYLFRGHIEKETNHWSWTIIQRWSAQRSGSDPLSATCQRGLRGDDGCSTRFLPNSFANAKCVFYFFLCSTIKIRYTIYLNLNTLAFVSFKIRTDFELSIIELTKIWEFCTQRLCRPTFDCAPGC